MNKSQFPLLITIYYLDVIYNILTFIPYSYLDNPVGCGVSSKSHIQNKITGGQDTSIQDWPWVAALVNASNVDGDTVLGEKGPFCGGVVISKSHILTAAHCVDG